MKNSKIAVAAISLLMFFSLPAFAQKGDLKFDINYNYSVPGSQFKSDLVHNNSPRGLKAGLMYSFNDKLAAGLSLGFQDYYEKYPRATYSLGKTQDISAVLTNSIQTTPILLKARYNPLPSNTFLKPYISIAAGTNIVDFKQYFGEFSSGHTSAGFMAEGGLGVMIPFKKSGASGINLGAAYNYAPYNKDGYHDLNSVNFHAGITFRIQ